MMPYCIQNVFILLGPALFAASVYMVLGRIITAVGGEHHSLIRVNWLTKIFVLGDVLSFLVQGGAAGMMVSSDLADMGKNIVIAGLLIQVIMFGLFIVTAICFQTRMHKRPTAGAFNAELPWKSHLYTLYMISLLIMVRSIFRVAEFAMGYEGYLLSHEWTLYVFDALLMWIVMVLFGYRYPGELQGYLHHPEVVGLCDVQSKA
ncbi:RTA1 domain-containing protein [Aspergillus melleus]|uniref:RTA1 domain-containing protein n=1 Tax=Aspergillus melleus TaxID=138277 RepID=UPI001E8E3AC6|nr:uncharacterized protein LDX57_009452 [Aspergillus melleus]KAH8431801.1 hypothetical protein LDX57_009452 [Aspergillus melleus]